MATGVEEEATTGLQAIAMEATTTGGVVATVAMAMVVVATEHRSCERLS